MQNDTTFRIGYLARRYGVSTEAIRLWERQGLMPPAHRTPGGHRRYSAKHRQALDAIIIPAVNDADETRAAFRRTAKADTVAAAPAA